MSQRLSLSPFSSSDLSPWRFGLDPTHRANQLGPIEVSRDVGRDHLAVPHDDDAIGHGHRFDLIMRHIDGRGFQPLVQFLDFGAHLHAQFGVEVGERLVEQEHLRVAHDGAAHGDALALAAGKLARIAGEVRGQAENTSGAADFLVDHRLRRLRQH